MAEQQPDIQNKRLDKAEIERNFADLHPPLSRSEALIEAEKRMSKSEGKGAVDENGRVDDALLKLLIDAYQASKRDVEGYASLSEVGKIAGNRSSFDVRNYGYSRLSDMLVEIPNFQTKRDENGHLQVKRLR